MAEVDKFWILFRLGLPPAYTIIRQMSIGALSLTSTHSSQIDRTSFLATINRVVRTSCALSVSAYGSLLAGGLMRRLKDQILSIVFLKMLSLEVAQR